MLAKSTSSAPALPLDLFRVSAGFLVAAYFCWLLLNSHDFTGAGGFIDHALSQRLFWFTRASLLQAEGPVWLPSALLWAGLLLSLLVAAGVWPKRAAAACFVICVSVQRWNFLVYYVDDMVIQLLLFWLILLPVGNTLSPFARARASGRVAELHVPALAVRAFVANVCLIYWVAGVSKLTSPMWLDGIALYAVLKLPIARLHDFWTPGHIPVLRGLNYVALAAEIAIPFFLLSRRTRIKLVGLCLQLSMHAGIIATIGIPFANCALPAASLVFFREEIAAALGRGGPAPSEADARLAVRPGWREKVSAVYVAILSAACLYKVAFLRPLVVSAYAALWAVGLVQNYHLFDWIDSRNCMRAMEVRVRGGGDGAVRAPHTFLPDQTRGVLLEMNLYDMVWLPGMNLDLHDELKCDILRRGAKRFCQTSGAPVGVEVASRLTPITTRYPDFYAQYEVPLADFSCRDGGVRDFRARVPFRSPESARRCDTGDWSEGAGR